MTQQNHHAMARGNGNGQTMARTPVEALKAGLAEKRPIILALLGERSDDAHKTDRILTVAAARYAMMVKGSNKPVDPGSVIDCVLQAAQLGLEAGGDQAYLVPYNGKVQLIVSPRGLIDLAFRHPAVADIDAEVVRTGDDFEYQLGDKPYIRHRKGASIDKKGEDLLFAYAVMHLVNGGTIRSVLTAAEVERYRSFSKSTTGPWFDNTDAMWRKTALKRVFAKGPRSAQMAMALSENDLGHYVPPPEYAIEHNGTTGEVIEAPPREPASQPKQTAPRIYEVKPQAPTETPEKLVELALNAAVVAGNAAAAARDGDAYKAARKNLIAACRGLRMADKAIEPVLLTFKERTTPTPPAVLPAAASSVATALVRESGDDTDAEKIRAIDEGRA